MSAASSPSRAARWLRPEAVSGARRAASLARCTPNRSSTSRRPVRVRENDAATSVVAGGGSPDVSVTLQAIDSFGGGAGGDEHGRGEVAGAQFAWWSLPAQGGQQVEVAVGEAGGGERWAQPLVDDHGETGDAADDEDGGGIEVGADFLPAGHDLGDPVIGWLDLFHGRYITFHGSDGQ